MQEYRLDIYPALGYSKCPGKRLRSSISDINYQNLPKIAMAWGTIRNVVSASLNLLRIIEDEALKENTESDSSNIAAGYGYLPVE